MKKANGHNQSFRALGNQSGGQLLERPDAAPLVGTHGRTRQVVEIDGAVLSDGRIIDLVRSSLGDQFALLVWKDGEVTVENQVMDEDKVYVAPKLSRGLAGAVQLPSGLGAHATARELIAQLEEHAQVYLGLPEDNAFLIAAFALSTFFPDVLPLAVYLIITGPPSSNKTTLLRFLHCVTRRALHAGVISRASLYKVSDLLSPTWLLDEGDADRTKANHELMRMLRNGNRPGADTFVNGERYRTYGPKVICGRRCPEDAALTSRALRVTLTPGKRILPLLDREAERMIAAEMQPKLERFRLEHFREVRVPELPGSWSFTPRMREIARVLAAPFLSDPDLTGRLLHCLKDQDQAARIDRYSEPEWVVAAALYLTSHEAGNRVFIGNLRVKIDYMLILTGETYKPTNKAVGKIARESLGVNTKRIGLGYYIELTSSVRRKIHELARNMGLTKADISHDNAVEAGFGGRRCHLCTEFGLDTLPDGTKLKYVDLPPPKRRGSLFGPVKEA